MPEGQGRVGSANRADDLLKLTFVKPAERDGATLSGRREF